jgi:chromosome segregation ATPase
MLQGDLEKYKDDLMEKNDIIADLQAQLAQRNIENDTLKSDKKNLQDELVDTRKVLEEKKRGLLQITKQNESQKKQHKDGSSAQYQLELENQRLRTTVAELEENEAELVQELELVSEERAELESKATELAAKCDGLQTDLDTKTVKVSALETDYEELR